VYLQNENAMKKLLYSGYNYEPRYS